MVFHYFVVNDLSSLTRYLRFFLLLLGSVMVITGCATPSPRLQPSGLNSTFAVAENSTFATYLQKTREMMIKARVDIHDDNWEVVLKANMPFELRPDEGSFPKGKDGKYRKGILLIHGLSDSPYLLQPLARHLQKQGFFVRTILLPGHGTVPGDLLNIRYQEWIRAAQYGIRGMKGEVTDLFLGGFSTGAALSVLESMKDKEIKGLILISPALAVKDKRIALAGMLSGVKDWVGDIQDDVDYAKYETFAVNAAYQIYLLTQEIDALFEHGRRIEAPVFAALSREDITIDPERALFVLEKYASSPRNVLVVYGKNPQRMEEGLFGGKIYNENSFFADKKVLDFSHVALPIPCDDRHYGDQGGYKSCLHYRNDQGKRRTCLMDDSIWRGEISGDNLQAFTVRRLTCNPKYDGMIEKLDQFLKSVDQ
ncbi:MAG: alpha/beta hydrolase [Deltaproteobacteria bacterium]|nr:alpha/beta hydrolase [Deltaproteobacteria bacterium]